jgi:hypothetical protein
MLQTNATTGQASYRCPTCPKLEHDRRVAVISAVAGLSQGQLSGQVLSARWAFSFCDNGLRWLFECVPGHQILSVPRRGSCAYRFLQIPQIFYKLARCVPPVPLGPRLLECHRTDSR